MSVTAKCIDQYVKLRVANADGNDEPVPMDSRLEGVVEKMFDRCIKDHQYKQVLHVFRILIVIISSSSIYSCDIKATYSIQYNALQYYFIRKLSGRNLNTVK